MLASLFAFFIVMLFSQAVCFGNQREQPERLSLVISSRSRTVRDSGLVGLFAFLSGKLVA
jgi:hypothetical protein